MSSFGSTSSSCCINDVCLILLSARTLHSTQQILQPLEYVTLASVSKGKQGMILGSTFHVETAPNVSNPQPNWVEGW